MSDATSGKVGTWSAVAPLAAEGTWLLEASAGTGKTWQLASLVARLVVEPGGADGNGLAIGRLLLMTFTRAAAAELRERVRTRLMAVRHALEDTIKAVNRGVAPAEVPGDDVLNLLVHGRPGEGLEPADLERRLRNVRQALMDFDQATISTIHSFSQGVLDTLAFESGQDTELSLVESTKAVRDRLAADAVAERMASASLAEMERLRKLGWTRKTLGKVADEATRAGAGEIEPEPHGDGDGDPWPAAVQALTDWWRSEDGGQGLIAMLRAELDSPNCRLNRRSYASKTFEKAVSKVDGWLEDGAGWPITSGSSGLTSAQAAKLTRNGVESALQAGESLELALMDRFEALLAGLGTAASALLADFGRRARVQVEAELQRRRELSFDAILTRLAKRIEEKGPDGPLATAIAGQFDVAMVDEFQDTDSAQWTVLEAVFHGRPGKRLFLVGDPKQAIYAFRGADVHVYLAAKAAIAATQRTTMARNYRSDERYIAALNHLWTVVPGAFGDLDMAYVAVDHKPDHAGWALRDGPPVTADVHIDGSGANGTLRARRPLELRWLDDGPQLVDDDDPDHLGELVQPPRRARLSTFASAAARAAKDCAAEIRALLDSDASLPGADDHNGATRRPLAPRDIAVLVNAHQEATLVKTALWRHGIMAVAAGKATVYQSAAAAWLLLLLDAIASPGHEGAARRLAICPLFGWSVAELESALDDASTGAGEGGDAGPDRLDWVAWRGTLNRAAERWQKHRFAGVVQELLAGFSVIERLLGLADGERLATDLRHLVELCHSAERRAHLGPVGLASWLRQQRLDSDSEDPVGNLRLESDADAVRVVTLYKAKGLQYPIVMLPFAWRAFLPKDEAGALVVHPTGGAGAAVIDLHARGTPIRQRRLTMHRSERRQEDMRKLYVALTRAEHHCVAWFGPAGDKCAHAALNRLLLRTESRRDDEKVMAFIDDLANRLNITSGKKLDERLAARQAAEEESVELLEALAVHGEIGWRFAAADTSVDGPRRANAKRESADDWRVASLQRQRLGGTWQRASFTSMVGGRQVHGDEPAEREASLDAVGLAPAAGGGARTDAGADESTAAANVALPGGLAPSAQEELPLAAMWGGRVVGTWVHAVFEHLGFQPDEAGALFEKSAPGAPRGRDAATLTADLGQRFGHRRGVDRDLLLAALPTILRTPLDSAPLNDPSQGLPAGLCLADLTDEQRMDELDFDLSLVGGERWQPGTALDGEAVADALRPRLGETDWDGRPWLATLMARSDDARERAAAMGPDVRADWTLLPRIAGILTGQVDLVFRAGGRLYLADYKTNRISPPGQRHSRPMHYSRPWLAWAMAGHGYHLQALIYTVALHRLLADRLGANYDYDRHFGGHLYLFVRGMVGPQGRDSRGQVQGVYADRWPRAVVEALDRALDPPPSAEAQA